MESPVPVANKAEQRQKLWDWMPYTERELKRVGVTRWHLWAEYKNTYPDGFCYGHFCKIYQQWQQQQEVTMHIEHQAGDKLYADYAGKKLQLVDSQSGDITQVEVLVAVLGCSQLAYVEAQPHQRKEDFIGGLERALRYFGGVAQGIVTDNLKIAVTKSSKYAPILNETAADFALHYGTTLLPTRAYKPRDKGLVEGAVKIVYQRIYAMLRNQTFFSMRQLNETIAQLLERYNTYCFTGRDYSRRQLFEQVERSTLKPLPSQPYEIKQYKWLTVLKNSHFFLSEDKHYYSVPYRYVGKGIKVIYTSHAVEIYYHRQRVALHQRNHKPYGYTTVKEHMPSAHQFVSDWNPQKFLSWAKDIGQPTWQVVEQILQSKQHPEQAYKSCIGILHFARKVGNQRLNDACQRAIYYQSCNYYSIKNILDKQLDKEALHTTDKNILALPFHENIRGGDYYQ